MLMMLVILEMDCIFENCCHFVDSVNYMKDCHVKQSYWCIMVYLQHMFDSETGLQHHGHFVCFYVTKKYERKVQKMIPKCDVPYFFELLPGLK